MPLTLPSEVDSERWKVSHHPVILIEFTDKSFFVASEQYLLDLGGSTRPFDDLLKLNDQVDVSMRISEMLGGIGSVNQINITILDWENAKTNLIGTTPDLTNSEINVYLKFSTSNTSVSNRLKIFNGFVSDYSENLGVLRISAKSDSFDNYGNLPSQLISDYDSESINDNDLGMPLQYGDFDWGTWDGRFWSDYNDPKVAICPLIKRESSTNKFVFAIASHQMENLPSAADLQDETNFYAFIRRNGKWLTCLLNSVVITNSTPSILKTQSIRPYYVLNPLEIYTSPAVTNAGDASNAIDGKQSTKSVLSDGYAVNAHNFDIDPILEDTNIGAGLTIYSYVDVVGTSGVSLLYLKLRKKSDNSVFDQTTVTSSTTGWIELFVDIPFETLNDYYIEVSPTVYATKADVYEVVVLKRANNFNIETDEKCIYLRCQGREFSGTWDSRKTAGNLIEHPVDMIESIIRDELGLSPNTESFDRVQGLNTWKVKGSIIIQESVSEKLQQICEMFGYGLNFDPNGLVTIISFDPSQNFSASGLSTPNSEDIFTDSETITNGSFNQHPILLDSFKLKRTNSGDKKDKVIFKYKSILSRDYLKTKNVGTGDSIYEIENYLVQDDTTANDVSITINNFRKKQRFIIEFTTFFNGINFYLGDIINIRHSELSDDFFSGSVNTQKWLIIGIKSKLLKGLIEIKALEL